MDERTLQRKNSSGLSMTYSALTSGFAKSLNRSRNRYWLINSPVTQMVVARTVRALQLYADPSANCSMTKLIIERKKRLTILNIMFVPVLSPFCFIRLPIRHTKISTLSITLPRMTLLECSFKKKLLMTRKYCLWYIYIDKCWEKLAVHHWHI